MRIQALFAIAALALGVGLGVAGCGGSPGTATVEGTIDKKPLKAAEAASFELDANGFGAAVVIISSEPGVCEMFEKGDLRKNTQMLQIAIAQLDFATLKSVPPTDTGEIPVFDPNGEAPPASTVLATVTYLAVDDKCQTQGDLVFATSGTLSLDSIDDGAYAGSGDVKLSTGDHITFEFDTKACGKIADIETIGTQASCN